MNETIKRIDYSKYFDKQLRKAPLKIKVAFRNRLKLFFQNSSHPQLRNHSLSGMYKGLKSINITGDWRAIYKKNEDSVIFLLLGTHSQLYN